MKRTSLLLKFGIIFLLFTLVTLTVSGIATYMNQTKIYQVQKEELMQQIADYMADILQADGSDFPMYQKYFLEHHDEINVPGNFSEDDVLQSRKTYETMFNEKYAGKTLGVNIDIGALDSQTQNAYAVYNHEYYLNLFEKAAARFNLAYLYYVVPTGEGRDMCFVLDAVRELKDDTNLVLGIVDEQPITNHGKMWEAWETGKAPSGYDSYDNEYGKTYGWYVPLYIKGEKLGLICIEEEIADYNHAIFMNTMRQLASIALILVIAVVLTLMFIDRTYISKIRRLSRTVADYAKNKDASVAAGIEFTGQDELSVLGNKASSMILELDNYMRNLIATTEELSHTREQVDIESAFARKDALTGIRNRNAYEEELKRLTWQLHEGKTKFGFAVVDVNFLKRINDTYGHECGNITLKECCNLVCQVFKHSPVFRIGGDEFVVILENEDYDNIKNLVAEFNAGLDKEADMPWKQVSAAIGYALYNPDRDDCVENVFRRADKAMYKRKREMKALRS